MTSTRTILLAVLVCSLLAMPAMARPVRMHNRNSGNSTSSEPAPTVEQAQFNIDRRPSVMLRMWNSSYTEHPLGLAERYRGEYVGAALKKDLDMLYDEGWRRIMLLLPAGAPSHLVLDRTFEEYSLRSSTWKNDFSTSLREWGRSHPDVTLGLYTGFRFRNSSYPTQQEFIAHITPWVQMGIKEFGFDFSGAKTSRETFEMAHEYLKAVGARAIIEAYPRSSATDLDMDRLKATPAMSALHYHEKVNPTGTWKVDPRLTEVHVQVGRSDEEVDPRVLQDLSERGFVLQAFSASPTKRIKVLEALGIRSPDDGVVIENKSENRRKLRPWLPRRYHLR